MDVLLLDDNKNRMWAFRRSLIGHKVHWAQTAEFAIRMLEQRGPFDVVLLDHDLDPSDGESETFKHVGTGMQVVDWIVANRDHENVLYVKNWIVHSLAGAPATQMVQKLKDANLRVCDGPWCWLDKQEPLVWAGLIPESDLIEDF